MKKLLLATFALASSAVCWGGFTTDNLKAITVFTAPNGPTPPTTLCDTNDERGRIFIDTNAATGMQIYGCEGTSGWVLQGDGNTGGGGGGGSSSMAVEIGDTQISSPTATIDFSSHVFTGSESPTGEANIGLNASSVTLQGNAFNGANQLLQADSSGLIPNADIDSSSVTKLGPSIDISDETNLAVTAPIILTGDTVSIDKSSATLVGPTITLATETDGIYVASITTNSPITGGAQGEAQAIVLSLTQNAGTDITADLEEEGVTCSNCVDISGETNLAVSDPIVLTNDTLSINNNLPGGSTSYIQNRNTLQSGATAYPSFLHIGSSGTAYGPFQLAGQNEVRFADLNSSNYVGFKASATVASNFSWVLPVGDGTTNQVLATDGGGTLFFKADNAGSGGSGTTIQIQDGGSDVVNTSTMDFTGAEFVVTDNSGEALIKLDQSSVTLQGNFFNGANQLLRADAAGLIPNADIDSSSVTKLGPMIDLNVAAEVEGTLGLANGGTNATSFQTGGVVFEASGALSSDTAFTYNGTTDVLTLSTAAATFITVSTMSGVRQIRWSDGTVQVSSPPASAGGSGDIEAVNAGYGLTGGGTSGSVTLNLNGATTSYIQNRNTLQSDTTAYPNFLHVGSSGTVYGPFRATGSIAADGGVACTDCIALNTETSGNYVASANTTAPLTGGSAGSEAAALTLDIDRSSFTLLGPMIDLNVAAEVEGTLAVGNGGTGATSFTANGVLYGNTASAIQVTALGGASTVLTANGGAPSFSSNVTVATVSLTQSFNLPATSTHNVTTIGQVAIDTDTISATMGAIIAHDGTQKFFVVGTTNTPSNGFVPKYDSGTGKISWTNDLTGAGASTTKFAHTFTPLQVVLGSGTFVIQNSTSLRPMGLFDASATEWADWQPIKLYPYQGGGLTADIAFTAASATSGGVTWTVQLECITTGDAADYDTASFDVVNSTNGAQVPATAGHLKVVSVTLTNADSCAQSDSFRARLQRNPGQAADTATGDAEFRWLNIYEP